MKSHNPNPDLNCKIDKLYSWHHSLNMQHPFFSIKYGLLSSANPLRNQACHSQISAVYIELTLA